MPKELTMNYLKSMFGEKQDKLRNYNFIRQYFDLCEHDKYTIDDTTWSDLNMNESFKFLDQTVSTAGESILYSMLRNPLRNKEKLQKRDDLIKFFTENPSTRTDIQYRLYMLGKNKNNSFLDMLTGELHKNKTKYIFYNILGKVVPLLLIAGAIIFKEPNFMFGLMISIYINIYINSKEKQNVKSNGLSYLLLMLKAGEKISSVEAEELKDYSTSIKETLKRLKPISTNTKLMNLKNSMAGIFEILSIIFLLEESAYYKLADKIDSNFDDLMDLYRLLGELDALISIASYKKSVEKHCSTPKFTNDLKFNITNGVQPLLVNGVPNSLTMKKKGIVLTGTNMSGKSTFLRMLGSNILLAQTFNFVLADKYEACFFNLVSSISPDDNLSAGKSYYMAEAEGILRIINALDDDVPVFCAIDEIFRGTNPVERISASAEILTYINKRKCFSIVATHDRELTDILKENYDFHYFSENVNSKKGLSFDYKLKNGISKTKNAIKLLDYIGYPKEIVDNSYRRADKIEGFL